MSQDFEDKIINLDDDDAMNIGDIDDLVDNQSSVGITQNQPLKKKHMAIEDGQEKDKSTTKENLEVDNRDVEVSDSHQNINHSKLQKVTLFFKDLWQNPKKRWSIIVAVIFAIIGSLLIPVSRYFILNTAGVRSSASVTVLDESTGQPLKNVVVKIGDIESKTDNKGFARLNPLKLGKTKLVIKKRAFAEENRLITLGWGSNPLGEQKIKPVGLQYSFDLRDFLSDKAIEDVEATSDDYSALSNKEGRLVLTIDQPEEESTSITIKAEGYRKEVIEKKTEDKEVQTVKLVPDRPHVFVSKRSGKFDVYKIDADGNNEQLVLSGTGNEREDITLVPSMDKNIVAVVSSRDGTRNRDGYLLNNLTLINLSGDEVKTEQITKSERIRILGWSGSNIIYLKIKEGASAATSDREQLISYDTENSNTKEIARGNAFNVAKLINGNIYYAPSAALSPESKGFYKVKASGEDKKTIFSDEVWDLITADYDSLFFSVKNDWYEYKINEDKVLAQSGAPSNRSSKFYQNSPNTKNSVWIDQRDGRGVLIKHDIEQNNDKVITSLSGLSSPLTWLNNSTVVFRVVNGQEIGDYVVSIDGGEFKKIKDVTNTSGVDNDRYY